MRLYIYVWIGQLPLPPPPFYVSVSVSVSVSLPPFLLPFYESRCWAADAEPPKEMGSEWGEKETE